MWKDTEDIKYLDLIKALYIVKELKLTPFLYKPPVSLDFCSSLYPSHTFSMIDDDEFITKLKLNKSVDNIKLDKNREDIPECKNGNRCSIVGCNYRHNKNLQCPLHMYLTMSIIHDW